MTATAPDLGKRLRWPFPGSSQPSRRRGVVASQRGVCPAMRSGGPHDPTSLSAGGEKYTDYFFLMYLLILEGGGIGAEGENLRLTAQCRDLWS